MKLTTLLSLAAAVVLLAGAAIFLTSRRPSSPASVAASPAPGSVAVKEGGPDGSAQVINIVAKGGYTPTAAMAKAGVPVALKIRTDGTFDCTAAVRIPSLNWSKQLGPNEEVTLQIPAQNAGTTLVGVCSMGMNNFKITFE